MTAYKMLSSDSHVIEPPDLWEKRLDKRFRERAPRVVQEADGDWWIVDLGSTNGVEVNGKRVSHERLSHEDRIVLGRTEVTFESA